MKILLDHRWKGNVRELENVLERAVNIAAGDTILSVHLPEYLYHGHTSEGSTEELVELKGFAPIDEILKQTEKKAIKKALDIAGGSRKKAMNLLGMGKTSFYKKMKEHDIE
jgi:DNA-binding NtrC family response regulator